MSYFPYYPGRSYPPPGMTMQQYHQYLAQVNKVNPHLPPPPINSYTSQHSQDFYYSQNFQSQYSFPDQIPYFSNPDMRLPYYPPQHMSIPYSVDQYQPNQSHQLTQKRQLKRRSQKNMEKQIESAKKNSQSNIVNHFFSFFNSRQKSQKIVEKSLQSFDKAKSEKEKLIHLFYNTIHVLSMRKGRKYVNRKNLINLLKAESLVKILPQIEGKVQKIKDITLQQLCKVFRKCSHSFLQTYSIDSIITSKRISPVVMQQHLRRRRKVRKAILQIQ